MKQPLPTQKAPSQAQGSGRLDTATTTTVAPLRGEVFDGLASDTGMKFLGIDKEMTLKRLLPSAALIFFLAVLGAVAASKSKKPEPIGPFTSQTTASTLVKVQVEGQVQAPGVYDLPSGSRVQDALQKAGGTLPNADLTSLNLVEPISDGTKLVVPARSGVALTVPAAPLPVAVPTLAPTPPVVSPALAPSLQQEEPEETSANEGKSSDIYLEHLRQHPVDLNTATASDLQTLPGVGPKMAARILDYRQGSGGFRRVEELDNISGIGQKRLQRLREYVVVK